MKIGVYAGSFNPFHLGHLDVLRQAEELFDYVIVAQGHNPEKDDVPKEPFDNLKLKKDRVKHLRIYRGLLTDTLKEVAGEWAADVTLVRGLRNGADLAHEQNQVQFMKEMYPELKVVYFVCDKKYEHVSSTMLRNLRKFSEFEYQKYLPK
jgi:pantetheine-phosphate adenylyltransferase